MSVPRQNVLVATIAEQAGVSEENVDEVLTAHGVALVPVPPGGRSIEVSRLSIRGTRRNTGWDGSFSKTFDFPSGVTAFVTNENLRGKSSVLELISWILRGRPRNLRSDVQSWFEHVSLEYFVNGVPMAVVLTKTEGGFTAEVIRAPDKPSLRAYLAGSAGAEAVKVVTTNLSAAQFAAHQDQTMMSLLGLDPITNFQKHSGSDQGAARSNRWPAYFGGIYLPRDSNLLFGDTVFAGLPARILQMYCNVPLMGAYIRLSTIASVQRQDENNAVRRAAEDQDVRLKARVHIEEQLKELESRLGALPSAAGRSFAVVSGELREAERELDIANGVSREALRTFDEARLARQEEMRRRSNAKETQLAELLFNGLNPAHCPRCEQRFESQRSEREDSERECAVCTRDIPPGAVHLDDSTDETEDATDPLEALQLAESAAEESAATATLDSKAAHDRVLVLAAEQKSVSQADEFADKLTVRLEQARLRGQLEAQASLGEALDAGPSETIRVLDAALEVTKRVTKAEAIELFEELDAEILAIGRKLGIDNLTSVKLKRDGGMTVVTAGVSESFGRLSGGERVRLRVAVVVALLRVGHRSGVGSHPGLILLDSPGDELTPEAEAKLLRELDSLKHELPSLQVLVASDEPAAVLGSLEEGHIYSSLDGSPLW